jgi:carotenoid cleavage dioxygenase-like enzyme
MIHGVSLNNGKAEWYRNRWVRTPRFNGARAAAGHPRHSQQRRQHQRDGARWKDHGAGGKRAADDHDA